MSGETWAVLQKRAALLIRWQLLLILYAQGIMAYGRIQEPRNISVIFSSHYPSHIQAGEILRREEESGGKMDLCFFQDCGIDRIQEPEYGRNAEILAGGILGDADVYDWRLRGFAREDEEGCVIDRRTAETLFGSAEAAGRRIVFRDRTYQVRLTVDWEQRMLLFHPSDGESEYARVYIRLKEGEAAEDTAGGFLLRHGFSGEILEGGMLRHAAWAFLWLLPGGMYLSLFRMARQRKKEENPGVWTGICVFMVCAALIFLWRSVKIPAEWIPGRWSDFRLWTEKFLHFKEQLRLKLMTPGTVQEAENIIQACRSILFSLMALCLYLYYGRGDRCGRR